MTALLQAPESDVQHQQSGIVADQKLVAAVRRGDDRAFEALYERYHRRIHAYVFGMVKDHGRAEDITQEVFLRAWRSMESFRGDSGFATWLFRITMNICVDHARHRQAQPQTTTLTTEDDEERPIHDTAPTPEEQLDNRELGRELAAALAEISEEHRRIVLLRDVSGMSYTEIAQLDYPAMLYVFDSMAPGWGGAFISIAIIVGVAGAWLSFTMLPAETTSEMAERHLLPESWGKLNSKGAPQMSLLLVGACIQVFLIVLMFSEDAYNFAFSMCTVSIVITWAFIAMYQIKFSAKEDKNTAQIIIGVIALAFQVVGVLYNGWSFLLLTCVGYIPGFFVYAKARKDRGYALTKGEKVGMGVVSALGIAALVLVGMGVIGI